MGETYEGHFRRHHRKGGQYSGRGLVHNLTGSKREGDGRPAGTGQHPGRRMTPGVAHSSAVWYRVTEEGWGNRDW